MSDQVVIGTRGSALALWQAHAVADALHCVDEELDVEVCVVKTKGDKILDVALSKIGDKGLFTKELEAELLSGGVDMCVHSMKDVPSQLPEGCVLGAMLERADAADALLMGPDMVAASLDDLPAGARIGTGSLRRAAQLRARWPQVVPCEIRGNVQTRLSKADTPEYDGVILAMSGVERMGLVDRVSYRIPETEIVPAVGQGAIGIEIRAEDDRIAALCARIGHEPTQVCVNAERLVLAALEGGCQVPLGAHARFDDGALCMDAVVLSLDGTRSCRAQARVDASDSAEDLARCVIADLEAQGARSILTEILDGVR